MNEQNGVVFRLGVAADAERLVELATRTYYETFVSVNTPENMQAYLSSAFTLPQFQADLAAPGITFHVAEKDKRLIAYAKLVAGTPPACVISERAIEIERFYMDRDWHGTGIASALMEICLNDARRQGFKTVYLGVWEHNLRAQAFYRKWDFVRVGEHVFQMGDDPQIDWWMARPL
jgi:diamine N-acetyltransferase